METWSLQDLVSHPRRRLSKESQAESVEFLLAEGSKGSAVGKSGDVLCYVPWLMVMGNAQRPKKKKKLPWILSIRVFSRLHAQRTTPTGLYSNHFTAMQCFYLSGSTPMCAAPLLSAAAWMVDNIHRMKWARGEAHEAPRETC